MYAVIRTGGKQERVQAGDVVQIEKIEGDVGSRVTFNDILFLSKGDTSSAQVAIGKPLVTGAKVEAEIVGQGRGDKILIIKMKRRKQYRRTQGHRQYYTQVLVTKVDGGAFGTSALDEAATTAKRNSFQSHLAPKGLAHTPKTIGSRERIRRLAAGNAAATTDASAAPKAASGATKSTATKKAPAKTSAKTAAKTSTRAKTKK